MESSENESRVNMKKYRFKMWTLHLGTIYFIYCTCLLRAVNGCNFYPMGEYLRFVRIPENLEVGDEVLRVQVHPRRNFSLQPADKNEDAHYFTYRDVNRTHIAIILAQSLEELVDSDNPQNVLKFRLGCDFDEGDDMISAYLSVTVYVEDVNDHSPRFLDTPYEVTVDELTPTGLTLFKSIQAVDRDKANTPNSDVQYSIVSGNDKGKFALDSSHKAALVLKKPLDYDAGDQDFKLTVMAMDRGSPPRSTNTTIHVVVQDNDDLGPKFTEDVYRTSIPEFYPLTAKRIHRDLRFEKPISAYDQDVGINTSLRYDIISGNERHFFSLDPVNGSLFLNREIDLDVESTLPGNTFVLQVQASQLDNPLRTAQARVEVEILDLNDNLPEFEVDFYNISIVENLPNGFSVLQVMATDKDQGDNGEFTYDLEDTNGAFSIDPRSGWLTVRDQSILDRESHASLEMKVYAVEKNPSIVIWNPQENPRTAKRKRAPTPFKPSSSNTKDKTVYVFPDSSGLNGENKEYLEETKELMSYVNVVVTLLDANDNNPVFLPSNLYEFSIKSNSNIGHFIGKVKAIDPDLGRNGLVLYDVQRTSNLTITSPFQVDAQSGIITVAETPLLEGRHALFIEASDQPANPSERRYTLAVVSIDVVKPMKGQKASVPEFIGAPYEFWVGSNVGIGTSVGQIRITDAMDKEFTVYDLLHSYAEGVPFAVEERSGTITVVDRLSKYKRPFYDFEAIASQENINVTLITNATINVVDGNDERGVLMKGTNTPIVFRVKENLAGAIIGQLIQNNSSLAVMQNNSENIRFFIANQQDITDDIAIGQDGSLYTQRPLDREKREIYRLTVIAEYNKGLISGAGIYQVTIYVDDDNDNAPIFKHSSYEGVILENSMAGTEVNLSNLIFATDADKGANALFSYTLFGDGHEMFNIDQSTGRVHFIGKQIDREEKTIFMLKIVARDKGNLSSETKLTVNVIDMNDNTPRFVEVVIPVGEKIELIEHDEKMDKIVIWKELKSESSTGISKVEVKPKNKFAVLQDGSGPLFSVSESVGIGATILQLLALDKDTGNNGNIRYDFYSETYLPSYALSSSSLSIRRYFVVNEKNGNIIVARTLPPESEFRLNISAADGENLRDNLTIRLYVKDINDHIPIFKKSWYSFNVDEAIYSRKVLGKVDATDDDYGQNANVTYHIASKEGEIPFEISPLSGVFSVNGELDREIQDRYILEVVATDNGEEKQLSSSVSVEIQVLDVNDNTPKFYNYDELLEWQHPEADSLTNHNFESVMMIPVYRATLPENSPIGTTVTRVYANDSDFAGNGNGLILFSQPQRKNHVNIFNIDSKDGVVTTIAKLDYEMQTIHNLTIVASDLGLPSLSSTALLILSVTDIPEEQEISDKPVFISRYFEVEIEENAHTPVELLSLNLTQYYDQYKMKFTIINETRDIKKMFLIDPRNGTMYIIRSPDREIKDKYELIVRAEKQKISRNLAHMIYPVEDDILDGMSKFEVKVIVRIKDVNDNPPRFTIYGRPMVTAIPTTAEFGYQVIKLEATDPDLGLNADIRFQIINDQSQRFAIDPISGQVRAVASFALDAGRVFGFDVKATDRKGADDGKSAIANVFVYVLDENKQLVLVMASRPTDIESHMDNITTSLTSLTGYDIRIRKIETHSNSIADTSSTDVYIYGVDPMSNAIIDMDVLRKSLLKRELQVRKELAPYKILEVGGTTIAQVKSAKLLNTMELSIVALGCIVFLGALTTAICILCVKRSRRRREKSYSQQRLNAMAFSTDHLTKLGSLFPSGGNQCQELTQSYSEADSYIDMINSKQIRSRTNTIEEFGKAHQQCVKNQYGTEAAKTIDKYNQHKHDKSCIRFNQRPISKKRKGGPNEMSAASVNSSGQDSGIADGGRCACGHSATQTSEDSSNGSYEDSLKSSHNQPKSRRASYHMPHPEVEEEQTKLTRRASMTNPSFQARRNNFLHGSFSEDLRHRPPLPIQRMDPNRLPRRPSFSSKPILGPNEASYMASNIAELRRKQSMVDEPIIDYDQPDNDDMFNNGQRFHARQFSNHNYNRQNSKLLELSGQTAVFVATPAAAAIMRRQGSERLVLARPL